MISKHDRPTKISQIWRLLSSFGKKKKLEGSQDPINNGSGVSAVTLQRRYNLEIDEIPVRDRETARQLIEMRQHCYEVKHTLSIARRDVFMSGDGDDMGWTIADTLDDNETAIDPEVKAILLDLIGRYNGKEHVIGGRRMQRALTRALADGDCFCEFGIDKEGIGRNDYGISQTLFLPTWETFVDEDEQGNIQGYYQCDRLVEVQHIKKAAESGQIRYFNPAKIVHFCHERNNRYGESLWKQSLEHWSDLKRITMDKRQALRALGVVPNIHVMPPDRDLRYLKNYERRYKDKLEEGIITDLFMMNGGEIKKMANMNSDLRGFFTEVLDLRQHIVPAGFPQWLYPGLGLGLRGAREVAKEPAKAYARIRNDYCGMLTEGLKWFCDVELLLKLGQEEFLRRGRGKYRIVFPEFSDRFDEHGNKIEDMDESDAPGIEDNDDSDSETEQESYFYRSNEFVRN